VEDTAFYRYHRLVSLNEVGGNPARFGTSVEEFHRANQDRLDAWPHSMLSSSTHDSKRSEDVRARIDVLSEIPAEWRLRLRRWHLATRGKRRVIEGRPAPSRSDEYFLYQTLVGMWPGDTLDEKGWTGFTERIEQYVLKAAREAKEHTSWANTNAEYESALSVFTRSILERMHENEFLADFDQFHRRVERIGEFNSLSQCLLKLTSPGVPDIYQGNELPDFSLVDPDNRRPVDYELRRRLLEKSQAAATPNGSDAKLYLTWKALALRKQEEGLFREGRYIPLTASGEKSAHIVAFAREHEGRTAIVAVPRLCASLLGTAETVCDEAVWADTTVAIPRSGAGCYHNVFTGECIPLHREKQRTSVPAAKLFRHFPVTLLLSESPADPQPSCGESKGR